MTSDVEHFFMSMGHLYVLGEVSIQVLWITCLAGVESHEFFIYLEIKPLSDISLANTFFRKVSSLFILMMTFLAMQKLLNLV